MSRKERYEVGDYDGEVSLSYRKENIDGKKYIAIELPGDVVYGNMDLRNGTYVSLKSSEDGEEIKASFGRVVSYERLPKLPFTYNGAARINGNNSDNVKEGNLEILANVSFIDGEIPEILFLRTTDDGNYISGYYHPELEQLHKN